VTTSPDDVNLRLVPMLDFLARVGRRAAEDALGSLRPRHLTALTLLDERGPTGQQSLAEVLSLDPSNVVGLLNDLEKRGFVVRRRDPADRRRHIVELSADGRTALDRASAELTRIEDELFAALNGTERHALEAMVHRVVAANRDARTSSETGPGCEE
jgi:DNA-binding MarR family transcriptional regulator